MGPEDIPHRLSIVIDEPAIQSAVERVAREIVHDLAPNCRLLVIGVLDGARPFVRDLVRNLCGVGVVRGLTVEQDWLRASSYHGTTQSQGSVDILEQPKTSLHGRDVLIVDDIIDQGHTLARIVELVSEQAPASLRVCVLLDKPVAPHRAVKPDYVGLPAPDAFIVGYGLDYQEKYRSLPYLASLTFENAQE